MPVYFLTNEQRVNYGRYVTEPTSADLTRYFYLDDFDYQRIINKRGDHNRLGFAIQLTSLRYLGRPFDDWKEVPAKVLNVLAHRLGIPNINCLSMYNQRPRLRHIEDLLTLI